MTYVVLLLSKYMTYVVLLLSKYILSLSVLQIPCRGRECDKKVVKMDSGLTGWQSGGAIVSVVGNLTGRFFCSAKIQN